MESKLILERFWIFIALMIIGFCDYFENQSLYSLIVSSIISIFLVLLLFFKTTNLRVIGIIISFVSICGIITNLGLIESERNLNRLFLSIPLLIAGIALVLDKYDVLLKFIHRNKIAQGICILSFLCFLFIGILNQDNIDFLEFLILAVAVTLGLMLLLPTKNENK